MKKLVKSAEEKMWDSIMETTYGSVIKRYCNPHFVVDDGTEVWCCYIGECSSIQYWYKNAQSGIVDHLVGGSFEDIHNNINIIRCLESFAQKDNYNIADFFLLTEDDAKGENVSFEDLCGEKCPWTTKEIFLAWYHGNETLDRFFTTEEFDDEYEEVADEKKEFSVKCPGVVSYYAILELMRNDLIEKIIAWSNECNDYQTPLDLYGDGRDFFDDVSISSPYLYQADNGKVMIHVNDDYSGGLHELNVNELLLVWRSLCNANR